MLSSVLSSSRAVQVNIEIMTMRGEKVLEGTMIAAGSREFSVAGLPSGIYLVKLIGVGYTETIKLIKL